jgi:hypothetical protein
MSTNVLAGDIPDRDHSVNRFLGFVASAIPASVELVPQIAETEPVSLLAVADRPDWWTDGTLPGVMAGKRPAL